MKKLLTGNEAIARAFYEAGGVVASAYPGTPSTEILENIEKYKDELYCEWAPNEKVAMEVAIGAAIAGGRSLAAMKHVGLNVAADPLFTCSYTGINGGFVFISADDPELHSSQNEQDNRHYARAAKICMLEPANSQEALDMVKRGYEISEKYDVPVMVRTTTRVNHSKSLVEEGERVSVALRPYEKNSKKYDTIPANSRKMHEKVEKRHLALAAYSNSCDLNYVIDNHAEIGVIASGISFEYAQEVFGNEASYFKVGMSYPMPLERIAEFSKSVKTLYIVEELDPFMEEQIKATGVQCIGKELVPLQGELNPTILKRVLRGQEPQTLEIHTPAVKRAPALCAGCPHRGLFLEAGKYKNAIFSGDIGCYALGGSAPYYAKDTSICMGASISVGHGMKKAFEHYSVDKKVVAIIGDSTFFHTGMNSLAGLLYNKGTALTIILDNRITGMTGHQQNPGTGYTLMGQPTFAIDIEQLCRTLGAKDIRTIDPTNLEEVKEALEWGFSHPGAVIITRYPCALKKYTPEDKAEFGTLSKCTVNKEKCIGCRACVRTGCPALSFDAGAKKASIDQGQCTGCTICQQSCPVHAIEK